LSAGGNLGTAIFNAIFANVLGVFLTPLLAIYLLGAGKGVSLLSTLSKLANVVILPLILGLFCFYKKSKYFINYLLYLYFHISCNYFSTLIYKQIKILYIKNNNKKGQLARNTPIGSFAQKITKYSRFLSSLLL
jgi:hypothetical protein